MTLLKYKIDNEKGLTLIEVLVSITLLSIVIITFLTFFTNAFRFNSINDDSTQAMNIAREQQALIKEHPEVINRILNEESLTADDVNVLQLKSPVLLENNKYILHINNTIYDIKVYIDNDAQKKDEIGVTTYLPLHKIHVEIYKNEKLLSETYTYFEGEGE